MSEHAQYDSKMSNGSEPHGSEATTEMKRILVIDDEPMIGRLIAAMLRGHLVEAYVEPRAALARVHEVAFAAVLSDLLMPNANGIEVYTALGEQAPELRSRFVLMTGCGPDPSLTRFLAERHVPLLRKPFQAAELRACIDAAVRVGEPTRPSSHGIAR